MAIKTSTRTALKLLIFSFRNQFPWKIPSSHVTAENAADVIATDSIAADAIATDVIATDSNAADVIATDAIATDAIATGKGSAMSDTYCLLVR